MSESLFFKVCHKIKRVGNKGLGLKRKKKPQLSFKFPVFVKKVRREQNERFRLNQRFKRQNEIRAPFSA